MVERNRVLNLLSAAAGIYYLGMVYGDATGKPARRDIAEDPPFINQAADAIGLKNYRAKGELIKGTNRLNKMMEINSSGIEEVNRLLTLRDDAITVLRSLIKRPYLISGFELMPSEPFGLEDRGVSVWEMLDMKDKPQKEPPLKFMIALLHDDKNRHLETELYGNIDWLQVAEVAPLAYYHDPLDIITRSTRIPADKLIDALNVVFNLPALEWQSVNDLSDAANGTFSFIGLAGSFKIYANTTGEFLISQQIHPSFSPISPII